MTARAASRSWRAARASRVATAPMRGKRRRSGRGLSLDVVRELARTARGDIKIERTGDGTLFVVELPLAA